MSNKCAKYLIMFVFIFDHLSYMVSTSTDLLLLNAGLMGESVKGLPVKVKNKEISDYTKEFNYFYNKVQSGNLKKAAAEHGIRNLSEKMNRMKNAGLLNNIQIKTKKECIYDVFFMGQIISCM